MVQKFLRTNKLRPWYQEKGGGREGEEQEKKKRRGEEGSTSWTGVVVGGHWRRQQARVMAGTREVSVREERGGWGNVT